MRRKRAKYISYESAFGRRKKPLGLYIHIPFCEKKCNYCDFASFDNIRDLEKSYIRSILRLFADYAESMKAYEIDTVYIGGGTPSILSSGSLKKLFHAIKTKLPLKEDAEITCEVNPASAIYRKLKLLKKLGVNRLSIGVQSFNDEELKTLGRIHTAENAKETIENAKKAGFQNISADIIFSIPGQTKESFEKTLSELLALKCQHISAYSLKVEKGTKFYENRDKIDFLSEDDDRDLYKFCSETLENAGYVRYEISNFAQEGFESKHNLKYWNLDEYLGIGSGAHSYYQNKRFSMVRDPKEFILAVEKEEPLIDEEESVSLLPENRLGEYVMMKLRLKDGINEQNFKNIFHKDFSEVFSEKLETLIKGGFLEHHEGHYFFTDRGIDVSNSVLCELLELEDLK